MTWSRLALALTASLSLVACAAEQAPAKKTSKKTPATQNDANDDDRRKLDDHGAADDAHHDRGGRSMLRRDYEHDARVFRRHRGHLQGRVGRCGRQGDRLHHRSIKEDLLLLSVAIATINEGADLEAMLAMLYAGKDVPDEVVIVDDGSLEPIGPRLAGPFPKVRVIRNETRTGSGRAKHQAAAACTGDLIAIMDSHLRPPWDWVSLWKEQAQSFPCALFCPRSLAFQTTSTFDGRGATFEWDDQIGFIKPVWAKHQPHMMSYTVPCLLGGAYLIRRTHLDLLGGYAPLFDGYGCEEEYLSLRAWLCGLECRVTPFLPMPHNYDRTVTRKDKTGTEQLPWEMPYNRLIMASVLFRMSPQAWLTQGHIDANDLFAKRRRRIDAFRTKLHRQFRRTPQELRTLIDLKIPGVNVGT